MNIVHHRIDYKPPQVAKARFCLNQYHSIPWLVIEPFHQQSGRISLWWVQGLSREHGAFQKSGGLEYRNHLSQKALTISLGFLVSARIRA